MCFRRADEVAEAAARHDASQVFAGVRGMCRSLGSLPKRPAAHRKNGTAAHLADMAWHFEIVLNIDRPVNEAVVQSALDLVVPVLDVDWSHPSWEQVRDAIGRLKRRKAPGPDGVPAELYQVKGLAEEVSSFLTPHVQRWWHGDLTSLPGDWKDSHMVALYKGAGDRTQLDNWRGICLLQLLSKVVSLLVNDALRKVSEVILDESQMGFRPMRGCPETTFVARRVLEEFRVTRPSKEMLPMMKECMPCSLIFVRHLTVLRGRRFGGF